MIDAQRDWHATRKCRHHLCQRVVQGRTNVAAVWHELRVQGFKGSGGTVRAAMAQEHAVSSVADTAGRRACAWLVGWHERGQQVPKRAAHRRFVEALCAIEPQISHASSLARAFLGLIQRRDVDGFDR